ncbi:MAG: hypothetical protein AAF806_11855 [Bacteroidota bacterium]
MEKIIVLTFGIFFTLQFTFAQQAEVIEQEVAEWTQTYQLDQSQQKIVKDLVVMKYFNFEELIVLKNSDIDLYNRKRINIERQTSMGVKSILNQAQLVIYKQMLEEKRLALRQNIDRLKAGGAEKEALAKAIEELKALQ